MFHLPMLPYNPSSLEPFLSSETFLYHYGKHHKGYIDAVNSMIQDTELAGASLELIVLHSQGVLFANASQAWNHTFFWNSMKPVLDQPDQPRPPLKLNAEIEKAFGSFQKFQEMFIESAMKVLGSGWVWLVMDSDLKLKIVALPNADSPLKSGFVPLIVCDVWEHSYYIDYRNNRRKYVEGFLKVINWGFAYTNFESGKFPDMTTSMKIYEESEAVKGGSRRSNSYVHSL